MATACARPVYPPEVIAFVNKEISLLQRKNNRDVQNSNCTNIPKSMELKSSLQQASLKDSILVEVNIHDGQAVLESNVLRGAEVIKRHAGSIGSICFVVRRPAMSVLAALYKEELEGFDLFGIIKETGVDDEGLIEYYSKYFTYQLYRDQSFAFYHALGDRKIGVRFLFNPLSLVTLACEAWQRIRSKNINGNLQGEGLIQGGILVFDAKGKPLLMHQEQTGQDIPVADLVLALRAIRQQRATAGQQQEQNETRSDKSS